MVRCSVLGCKSDSGKKLPDLSFHSFPENQNVRLLWIQATGRLNWTVKNYSRICSRHFDQSLLIKKKKLTMLVPNAVPTLETKACISTASSSVSCMEIDECLDIQASSKTQTCIPTTSSSVSCMEIGFNLDTKANSSPNYTPRTLRRKWKRTEQTSNERLKRLRALREKSRRLTKKVAKLETIIAELKAKSLVTEEDGELLQNIDPANKDFLKKYLNPAAVGRKYPPALRKFALCLNFISPRAYKYVRQQFNTCLPHPSTLTAWYKSFDANPGFTRESLDCISLLTKRKNDKQLYCALALDEMAIRKHVQWDGEKCVGLVDYGEALDGHNVIEAREALVFMATSVNDGWKIPVGYFLINGCNGNQKANLVTQCIKLLSECGVIVISLTFDGCPSNFAMAKALGCHLNTPDNITPFFVMNEQEIVIIPDPAHMLKLVRNTLGQKKELTNGLGEKICWRFIENLHDLQESEGLHLANRLRSQHVNFTKQIMKVKLAAQTFSSSVANAIEYCNKKLDVPNFHDSDATVQFISKINNLFDILNSRNLNAYGFKKPISKQNGVAILQYLSECEDYIKGLKLDGQYILNTNRKVGFFGLLICISSLKKLYANYILTDKLNFVPYYKMSQDHLECFFSSIRSKGGFNNNPTALQFRNAYKRLVVHGEIKNISSGNCIPLEDIKILTHTEARYESKINKYTNFADHNEIIGPKFVNENNDHDYIPDPSRLNTYAEDIIRYIGGFVIRKIKRTLKCEDCLLALVSDKYLGFIFKKDKGGLIYPSKDVITICNYAERVIRKHLNNGMKFFAEKNILPKMILETFKRCQNVFVDSHFSNQPFVGNHRILLIKSIIAYFLELRIHHATKYFEPKEKIRNLHTKVILFQGQ